MEFNGDVVPANWKKVEEDGWKRPTFTDKFEDYDEYQAVYFKKTGKLVEITGSCKPTENIEGSTTQHVIFTLPEGYRPSAKKEVKGLVCRGSGHNFWMCEVHSNGEVCFSRYGFPSVWNTASPSSWLPFGRIIFSVD